MWPGWGRMRSVRHIGRSADMRRLALPLFWSGVLGLTTWGLWKRAEDGGLVGVSIGGCVLMGWLGFRLGLRLIARERANADAAGTSWLKSSGKVESTHPVAWTLGSLAIPLVGICVGGWLAGSEAVFLVGLNVVFSAFVGLLYAGAIFGNDRPRNLSA